LDTTNQYNWEFETITQHTLDILIIVDENQIVQYVTPSIETLLGYKPEEFIGKNAFEPLYPEDKEKLVFSHSEVIRTKKPRVDEYRVWARNASIKYLESRVSLIPDHPNNLVVVSIRDVTVRKHMEMELGRRKNRYQDLQNSLKAYSQDLSTVTKMSDLKTRLIQELNTVIPKSEPKIVIYHRENHTFEGEIDPEFLTQLFSLTVGKPHTIGDWIFILIGDRKDKSYFLALKADSHSDSMDSIWLETLVNYTIMVFDSLNVIESLMNQMETAIQRKDRPQWILRLLFNLSEKQRWELSSDLHDTVLQNQLDLYRNLQAIMQEHAFEKEMDDQLKSIVQGMLDTIHQIQTTCNELRPPLLRELGLESALQNLFEQIQLTSTYRIEFTTENTTTFSLNEEETIGLYRIVQELLNNANKHSQATNLHFHMQKLDDRLELLYTDNGKGLEIDRLTPTFKSMGLSGMRERVQSLNGTIEFHSEPGNGLSVKLQIPISQ
jgi:two-component system, NarL family, sensor histidine kinase ComP